MLDLKMIRNNPQFVHDALIEKKRRCGFYRIAFLGCGTTFKNCRSRSDEE